MKKIFRILSVLALCVPGIPFTASQAQVNTLYNTPQGTPQAAPKCISGSTSYLRV